MRTPKDNFEYQTKNDSREQHLAVIKFGILLLHLIIETEQKNWVKSKQSRKTGLIETEEENSRARQSPYQKQEPSHGHNQIPLN